MKKISLRSQLSSSSSALLLGLQEEGSLWLAQQGGRVLFLSQGSRHSCPGADAGFIASTRSRREASYLQKNTKKTELCYDHSIMQELNPVFLPP